MSAVHDTISQSYDGGCHCGYISFSMKLSPPLCEQQVVQCNCSICRRKGYLLVYPMHNDVMWHNDSKNRCAVYQFSTKTKDQLFCPKCGVSIGIDLGVLDPPRFGISVRAIHDVNLDQLKYRSADGLSKALPAGDLSGTEYKEHE